MDFGDEDDRVRLVLGGDELTQAESYAVEISYFTQPSTFSLRLGYSGLPAAFLRNYPPNTRFQLFIGDVLQQTGFIDEVTVEGGGASRVVFAGRDVLARLHDAYNEAEKTYAVETYVDLVGAVLIDAGMGNSVIYRDNAANRAITTGTASRGGAEPSTNLKALNTTIRAKLGERLYETIKRHLDCAGLFLHGSADGGFVISAPHTEATPLYNIVRTRDGGDNVVTANLVTYRNSTRPPRYSECVVYTRQGGKKHARTTAVARIFDREMQGYGIHRPLNFRDHQPENYSQASGVARRKIAEGRRACWELSYVVPGHTTWSPTQAKRVPWAVDTIVHVIDDELDIDGNFWIESVTHRRSPQTETVVRLMRPADLLFGEAGGDEFPI